MRQTRDNEGGRTSSENRDSSIDGRVFHTMVFATAFAVIASLPFAHWRVTTGLLVGGLLSLFNHHWLSSSTAAALSVVAHGAKPQLKLSRYILRYLVIGAVVFILYKLNLVSLAATIGGLCSFVIALFVEAFREFYLAIIHREEIS
jgi:hypothetical protein